MKLLALSLLVFSTLSHAADPMCVRNYAKQGGGSICTSYKEFYALVHHYENKETDVCTRIYADFYCENAPKEYERVVTLENKTICTLNYNQPGVANYCESAPQFYDYILKTP